MADRPKEVALDAPGAHPERLGHLRRRPLLHVPENEHLLLALRQRPERPPDPAPRLRVHGRRLRARAVGPEPDVVDRLGPSPKPPPPAGPPPITTGVDGHPGEPPVPVPRRLERPGLLHRPHEQLLDDAPRPLHAP